MILSNEQEEQISSESDHVSRPKKPRYRLPLCSKLCYAIGGVPYQLTGIPLGLFLQYFLLDVAELDPSYASIILFVGRFWDAITDPTVGYLAACSPWTRFGQMMPWILASTPLAVISYFLIWYVPPFGDGKVLWYLGFYCIFQTLVTCYHVPYTSLTMFITSEQKDRDSCTAYRMVVELLAIVLSTAIQGQLVRAAPCVDNRHANSTYLRTVNATHYLDPLTQSADSALSLDDTKGGYLIAAAVISAIYILCAIVLFFGVSETKESCHPHSESFVQAIRMVVGHGPYAKLMLGLVSTSMACFFLESNFALFTIHVLGFANDFQNMLLAGMISACLTIPFWQWFLNRYGKKTAVYCGVSCGMPFMVLLVLVENNKVATYCLFFGSGVSLAAVFLLPWSMLPDVVDDFKVANLDSTGHEAIFYSFYVFFIKFASGISAGISALTLDRAGYVTRGCEQPYGVKLTLKLLISVLPLGLIGFGLCIFYSYPIDEKRRQRNRKVLQELQDSQASEMSLSETTCH